MRLKNGFGKHKKNIELIDTQEGPTAWVSLGRRKIALLSVADLPILEDYSFYAHKRQDGKYVARSNQGGHYLHRLVMKNELSEPGMEGAEIDHINADPLDNTRGNLRLCSTRQNNLAKNNNRRDKIEGYYGITKGIAHGRTRYKAVGPSGIPFGSYKTAIEAAIARDELYEDEYLHREYAEEVFHPHAFIKWNGVIKFFDEEPIIEMDMWIYDEIGGAIEKGKAILEEKGWKL